MLFRSELMNKLDIYKPYIKGFKDKKNADLWTRFLKAYRRHRVRFVWVKGHADIPENERCDRLAVAAASLPNLPPDTGYRPET